MNAEVAAPLSIEFQSGMVSRSSIERSRPRRPRKRLGAVPELFAILVSVLSTA